MSEKECVQCESRIVKGVLIHKAGCQESDPSQRHARRIATKGEPKLEPERGW